MQLFALLRETLLRKGDACELAEYPGSVLFVLPDRGLEIAVAAVSLHAVDAAGIEATAEDFFRTEEYGSHVLVRKGEVGAPVTAAATVFLSLADWRVEAAVVKNWRASGTTSEARGRFSIPWSLSSNTFAEASFLSCQVFSEDMII